MVLTRAKNKPGRKPGRKNKTLETTSATVNEEVHEETERKEELLTVASLVNWPSYDRIMAKLFYEKFGKVLEEKVADYEHTKAELKQCIERNLGGNPRMQTPRRANLMGALREQIAQIKVNLEENEEELDGMDQDSTIVTNTAQQQTPPTVRNKPLDNDVVLATPEEHVGTAVMMEHTPMAPKTPLEPIANTPRSPIKARVGTPAAVPQSLKRLAIAQAMQKANRDNAPGLELEQQKAEAQGQQTPGESKKATTSNEKAKRKEQKLKELEEREKKAQKQREEQLKDKVERAKREREERRQRFEHNLKVKETERKEHEELRRAQEAIKKKFDEEQKRLAASPKARTPAKKGANANKVETLKKDAKTTAKKTNNKEKCPIPPPITPPQISMPTEEKVNGQQQKKAAEESVIVLGQFKTPQQQPPVKIISTPILAEKESPKLDLTTGTGAEEISNYDMTMNKIPLPSTEDNYNVDDLSSADETDPEDSPRKQIPKWAQKENLTKHIKELRAMATADQIECFFGRVQQPTIQTFFKNNKKKYPRRHDSSAIWDSPMSDPTPGVGQYQNLFD